MASLSANKARNNKMHTHDLREVPVNAGSVIYEGAYIVREAITGLAVPGADTASVVPLGVAVMPKFPDDPDLALTAAINNTDGADGTQTATASARVVLYDAGGEWEFDVSAGTPKAGDPAYLTGDDSVATTSTNTRIAGEFTRPGPGGGWFVDVSRAGLARA